MRHWPRVLLALLLAPVGVAFVGYPVYGDPVLAAAPERRSADAIIALGGIDATAVRAYELAKAGVAPVLVIADPYGDREPPTIRELCRSGPVDVTVWCFAPDPSTTRGEAREIRRLSEAYGWDDVVVVTATYHVTRARWIIERCYDDDLVMVDAGVAFGPHTWAYHYVYQTAGYVRAALQRGC